MERNTEVFKFLWVGREKGKRHFRRLGFCAAARVSYKTGTERLLGRTAERVRPGRIGVEFLYDFHSGLGMLG
jgi:hypothetical protein